MSDPGRGRVLDLTTWKATPAGHGINLLRGYGHPVPASLAALFGSAWTETRAEVETLPTPGDLKDPGVLRDLGVRWMIIAESVRLPAPWTLRERREKKALWEDPDADDGPRFVSGTGTATQRRPSPDRIEIGARADAAGEIRVCEQAWPGWRAWRDGVEVPLGRHRGALMSVEVPAGGSTTVLIYTPGTPWAYGLRLAALGTALVLAAYLAVSRFPR
jgi:hypothetical protein